MINIVISHRPISNWKQCFFVITINCNKNRISLFSFSNKFEARLNTDWLFCREISRSLNLSSEYQETDYLTGIRRDPNNTAIWRRSSDNVEVQLTSDDWYDNFTSNDEEAEFVYWYIGNPTTSVWNGPEQAFYYVCEFVETSALETTQKKS